MITAASKPPKVAVKSGSISPVPPPLQFASHEVNHTANSYQQNNVKFSSQSSSSVSAQQKSFQARKGVQVLPVLSQPVQLQEPGIRQQQQQVDHVDHESNEADHFIEQLMKEAETDPKLRELTYGQQSQYHQQQQHQSQYQQQLQQQLQQQKQYQQSQQQYQQAEQQQQHQQPLRPSRNQQRSAETTNYNRSKSADGRLKEASKHRETNATETLLNEVVTDEEHRSVKNLVNMIEGNIKAESLNPYVRKWGCDLISPEPHKKNVTYRSQKREIVDPNALNSIQRGTYTWQQDDHFQHKNNIANETNMVLDHFNNQHSPSGRDDHDSYLEQHTAELDDLIGRRPSLEMSETGEAERTVVVWPPPSPLQPEPEQNRYPSPLFSPSPPPPMAVPLPPSTPSPVPILSPPEPLPKKSNLKKRSQSEGGGHTRRFSNSSLNEIDQQIAMIQNEFEAELDTLIDVYRNSKSSTSKTTTTTKSSSQLENHQQQQHHKRSRKGKHQASSDDEDGTYQALSVVFEDRNSGHYNEWTNSICE